MKRVLALILLFTSLALPCAAQRKRYISFEATVVRIESWGLARLSCGVFANYRLAEYEVGVVYGGQAVKGQRVVVKHLACNYNELDELSAGDKVLVVAEVLGKPDTMWWKKHPVDNGEPTVVNYRGVAVGKLVYPTADSPR